MSSLSNRRRCGKLFGAALLSAALALAGGCTVRPLYGNSDAGAGQGTAAALSAIEVKPAETRQALEVRNHLIFLLSGGAGQPANPAMVLDLDVISETSDAATVQIATDNEPSAGVVTMTARYLLLDASTGNIVTLGERSTSSSFDRLRQEFATLRAERDAENRAARELAELLRLAIAQDLKRRGSDRSSQVRPINLP